MTSSDFAPIGYTIVNSLGAVVARAVLPQGEPIAVAALARGSYVIDFDDAGGRRVARRFVE